MHIKRQRIGRKLNSDIVHPVVFVFRPDEKANVRQRKKVKRSAPCPASLGQISVVERSTLLCSCDQLSLDYCGISRVVFVIQLEST